MKRRAIPAISLALVVLFSASFLLALPGAVSMPASAVTQAEIDALKESAGELEQQQKEIQAQLNAIAADKDVRLTCTVAPNVPLSMADWEKLRRILENLVNNAIKYTHRGGFVRLTIGFEDGETDSHSESEKADTNAPDGEDAAAGWIVMRVADDGMGIAPEELDQIFELYKQAGQSANRRYRGTGLGLAVVRDLTELHGGTVTVESRVKEGSSFTVRIPYVPVIEEEDEEA